MNPLAQDLDHILAHTEGLWDELRGQRIFITGGTGFFGCWLLESFCWANDRLRLGAKAVVLTRNPDAFRRKAPHLATHPTVTLHVGDVRKFDFPEGSYSHVIHAATEASAKLNEENPLVMFDTIVEGTRHTLDFACHCGATKFLLTSSGAVYGRQPPDLSHIPEDYAGGPDPTDPRSAYGEGKRAAELLATMYRWQHGLQIKTARCFAVVGPYLPLEAKFAVGDFIRDALNGGPVVINGDGSPIRSYLSTGDLMVWLWTILIKGAVGRAYNVGSDVGITVLDLAATISRNFWPALPVMVERQPESISRRRLYVPCIERAHVELGLNVCIHLPDAIRRTLDVLAGHKRKTYE